MRVILFSIGLMLCFSVVFGQDEKWRSLEIEADSLMAKEAYKDAMPLYTQAIKLSGLKDPDSYLLLYKRSLCYFSMQQFEEAIKDVNDLIKLDPADDQPKLLKAYIARDLGDMEMQHTALNDLLLIDPANQDLLKWRASVFIEEAKYTEAQNDIKAAKKMGNDAELETYTGICYYYQSQPDSAILHFDKAIALDKSYLTSYMYAAYLCFDEEAYDLALTYLNQALQLDPANLSLQFYKGIALVEKKNLTEGCRYLTKAFKGGIDDAGGYLKESCYTEE